MGIELEIRSNYLKNAIHLLVLLCCLKEYAEKSHALTRQIFFKLNPPVDCFSSRN